MEDGDCRLSWHLTGEKGGYRIGNIRSLNKSMDYKKIICIIINEKWVIKK